jgi:hypothetical protein
VWARLSGVADAIAAGERRGDERQELVAGVRPASRSSEIEVQFDARLLSQACRQRGRRQEAASIPAWVTEADDQPLAPSS